MLAGGALLAQTAPLTTCSKRLSSPSANVPGEWICRHRAQPNSSHIPPSRGHLSAVLTLGKGRNWRGFQSTAAAALLLTIDYCIVTYGILVPLLSIFQNFAISLMYSMGSPRGEYRYRSSSAPMVGAAASQAGPGWNGLAVSVSSSSALP